MGRCFGLGEGGTTIYACLIDSVSAASNINTNIVSSPIDIIRCTTCCVANDHAQLCSKFPHPQLGRWGEAG